MGSLKENVETAKVVRVRCKFRLWYLSLDAEDQQVVKDVLFDNSWTINEAMDFFTKHGNCPVRDKTIRAHRNGICWECGESWG